MRNLDGNRDWADDRIEARIYAEPMWESGSPFVSWNGTLTIPPRSGGGDHTWLWLCCDADGSNVDLVPTEPFVTPNRDLKRVVGNWGTVDRTTGDPIAPRTTLIRQIINNRDVWFDHAYADFGTPAMLAIMTSGAWSAIDVSDAVPAGLADAVFMRLEAKRTDTSNIAQVNAGTIFDPAIPYFHERTQAKAYSVQNQGGMTSLDRAWIDIEPGQTTFYVAVSSGHEGQIHIRGYRLAAPPLPLATPPPPPPSETEETIGAIFANTVTGNFTYIDRGMTLDPGRVVTALGCYSSAPASFPLKIVKQTVAWQVDVAHQVTLSHPGGGWAEVATSFNVPNDGASYYAGAHANNYTMPLFGSRPRSYAPGNISGNGVAVTEQNLPGSYDGGWLVVGMRIRYAP
jgi:hypothetical protein